MERRQRIMAFVSNSRDHAAIWTLMEFIPNDPGSTNADYIMQDREGQWWLCSRDLYNTIGIAEESLLNNKYFDADETIVVLYK